MPRPKTKEELIYIGEDSFAKLFTLINSISKEEQEEIFIFEDRDRNIRDVLTHLYEWHQLILNWIQSNQAGIKKSFLPEPYNWKTYPKMNIELWEKHQNTPYAEAIKLLKGSHSELMRLIDLFTCNELFAKKHFSWTGTTSLGCYCASATSSHYNWAIKKIKTHKKSLKSQ